LGKPQLPTGNDRLSILDYVPQSVFQSWFNDEYFIGTGSRAAYFDLGTMLMLRGMYWYMMYPSETKRAVSHGGCCYVDIEQDELVFTGVRLYTSRAKLVKSFHLRPWRSVAAKIVHPMDLSSLDRDLVLLLQLCGPKTAVQKELQDWAKINKLPKNNGWAKYFPRVPKPDNTEPKHTKGRRLFRDAKTHNVVSLLQKLSESAFQLDEEYRQHAAGWMPNQASRLRVHIAGSAEAGRSSVSISGGYGTIGGSKGAPKSGLASGRVCFERISPEGGLQ
jgi:hypothetical protein